MPRIRLNLSYDGSHFEGWQKQKKGRTVQEELEKALGVLHRNRVVPLTAAGRTDAGVHAAFQCAHFDSHGCRIPPERFAPALNAHLPRDIRIQRSFEVPPDFHARYDAVMRVYCYYLVKKEYQKAHMMAYSVPCVLDLDINVLNNMASVLCGTHDFSSFAAARDSHQNKIRTLYSARFFTEGPFTVFRVVGNAFLWKMVRTMVGTILETYERKGSPQDIMQILNGRDRTLAGPSAKAWGLFLDKVIYGTEQALY